MAKNESNRWSNRHASITCASGNGKGIAVTSLGLYPSNSCLAIFDPYSEYRNRFGTRKTHAYKSRRGFARAFSAAWRSGKPFALVYMPKWESAAERIVEMEWFAQLIWVASDGNRLLHVLFEEFGKCTESIAKDDTTAGEIATGGRKFGIRAGYVFQRSAEVPKTIWANTNIKVIGAQGFTADVKRIKDQLRCTEEDVTELTRLNKKFAVYSAKYDDYLKTKCHYLVGEGMGYFERKAVIVYPNRRLVKSWRRELKELHEKSTFETVNLHAIPEMNKDL